MMQKMKGLKQKLCRLFYATLACTIIVAIIDCLYMLERLKLVEDGQREDYRTAINRFSFMWRNHKDNKSDTGEIFSRQCKRPKLDLIHDANKDAFYSMPPLQCIGKSLFYISLGMLQVNRSMLGDGKLQSCEFYGIDRYNDDMYTHTETVILTEEPFTLKVFHDFIHIRCFLKYYARRKLLSLTNPKHLFTSEVDETGVEKLQVHNFTSFFDTSMVNRSINSTFNNNKITDEVIRNIGVNTTEYSTDGLNTVEEEEHTDITTTTEDSVYYPFQNAPDFEQFVAHMIPKKNVFKRIDKLQGNRHSPNVVVLGLDSMSHLSYQRKLPKTYHYLKNVLGAAIMDGYNIVGDATVAAMLPILTGKTILELPEEARRGDYPFSSFVDNFPIIWKRFKKQGYATFFAEDEPGIGMFNLRLNGFEKVPTDHYMRPFWQAVGGSELRDQSKRFCTGDIPSHRYMFDYLQNFFVEYRNVSKFALTFATELTHANNNPAEYIDDDFVNFLKFLENHGFIDNTVIVTMSDHGARYSKVRKTVQGKLEERLPFMSFVFPKWFHKKYPHLIKNLHGNSAKITTPFDIHETFHDILEISRTNSHLEKRRFDLNARGISLLRKIPKNRTCAAAHIDIHWCACLQQIDIDTDSFWSRLAATRTVQYINNLVFPFRNYCVPLELKNILMASVVIPNEKVLKYKSTVEYLVPQFHNSSVIDVAVIQVTLETTPNNAMFEATVQVHTENKTCTIADISRISRYGDQPKCIQENYPEMRQFCYCKNYTSSLEN